MKELKTLLKYWTVGIIIVGAVLGVICSFFIDWNDSNEVSNFAFGFFYVLLFIWLGVAIPLIIEIVSEKSAKKDIVEEELNDSDFEKIKEYYREILNINSPLIIGFIDDFEINKDALIAELLYLKYKNIIEIKDEKIEVIYSGNRKELSEIQRYILYCLENGKLKISDSFKRLKYIIRTEAKDYVETVKIKRFSNKKRTIMYFLRICVDCLAFEF